MLHGRLKKRRGNPPKKMSTLSGCLSCKHWRHGRLERLPKEGRKEGRATVNVHKPSPTKTLAWGEQQEKELHCLKTAAIQFKDTALSVALQQSAKAVQANILQLDDSAANDLMQALNSRQQTQTRELSGGEQGANL